MARRDIPIPSGLGREAAHWYDLPTSVRAELATAALHCLADRSRTRQWLQRALGVGAFGVVTGLLAHVPWISLTAVVAVGVIGMALLSHRGELGGPDGEWGVAVSILLRTGPMYEAYRRGAQRWVARLSVAEILMLPASILEAGELLQAGLWQRVADELPSRLASEILVALTPRYPGSIGELLTVVGGIIEPPVGQC